MNKLIYTIALVMIGITASNAQEQGKRKLAPREEREVKEVRKVRERIEARGLERDDKLTSEQRAEKAATAMQKRLSLTNEQKQKVKQIELDRAKKHEEWRKQDEKAMKNKMEDRKAYIESSKQKIEKILTEEQRKTFATSLEDRKEKMRERAKRPGRQDQRIPRTPRPAN